MRKLTAGLVFLCVPLVLLFSRLELIGDVLSGLGLWRCWLLFLLGWVIAAGSSSIGVAVSFRKLSGRAPREDPVLFNEALGHDLKFWSALFCYFSVLGAVCAFYSTAEVFSEIKIYTMVVIATGVFSYLLSVVVARVVFRSKMYCS